MRVIHAVALEQRDAVDEAIAELRQAVTLPSATADTWRILGDVLMHTRAPANYQEALEAFAKAAQMKPEFIDNLHDWGEALREKRDFDGAINDVCLPSNR